MPSLFLSSDLIAVAIQQYWSINYRNYLEERWRYCLYFKSQDVMKHTRHYHSCDAVFITSNSELCQK